MTEIGLFEAMYSARALRRLKPDPIPDEIIRKLIEAGTQAPQGSNQQLWAFMAITDAAQRKRIAQIYRKGAELLGLRHYGSDANFGPGGDTHSQGLVAKSVSYLIEHVEDPPLLLILCGKALPGKLAAAPPPQRVIDWQNQCEGASFYPAVQNVILACRAFGLGTCLTTLHALYEDDVRQVLGLPAGVKTWAMLPIGYPLDKIGRVSRKPVEEVCYRDRWGNNWPGRNTSDADGE